ncbi:MAG: Ribosomal small subunit methyltransferase [Gemmatimonadetes bacterium]|nr:Ribosomal small subunit methyltransferase [Gemmatimonadota bacterium]
MTPEAVEPGRLYVVSTPIGNMGDFSFRAVETLRSVAAVLAEDTRHSRHLLDRYEVATPMLAYHEHNEAKMTPQLVRRLAAGESLAIVTDAGTPLVSDPGARLVAAAIEAGIVVVPVPGASALLAALVASGLPGERFTFYGFLARRGRERKEVVTEIAALRHTAILYEAPSRVADTLADLGAACGPERQGVVAREITKQFEEVRRGTIAELAAYYSGAAPRGEIVILVGGAPVVALDEAMLRERARALREAGVSVKDAAARLAAEHGVPRNQAYRLAQEEDG